MMMVIDIKKDCPLDEGKLAREILELKDKGARPYIFMAQNTIDALIKCDAGIYDTAFGGKIATFRGCKVFTDNTLEYGEVELR